MVKSPIFPLPPVILVGALYGWSAGVLTLGEGRDASLNPILLPAIILNSYVDQGCKIFSINNSFWSLYSFIFLVIPEIADNILK